MTRKIPGFSNLSGEDLLRFFLKIMLLSQRFLRRQILRLADRYRRQEYFLSTRILRQMALLKVRRQSVCAK